MTRLAHVNLLLNGCSAMKELEHCGWQKMAYTFIGNGFLFPPRAEIKGLSSTAAYSLFEFASANYVLWYCEVLLTY